MATPSFRDLKRNRELVFEQLNKQINEKGGRPKDDRIWYPSVDANGNGFAIIRFLPAPGDEPCPWVKMWSYGFKARNGWYINNSRSTLGMGEKDPVAESNKALRATGDPADKKIADARKASLSFWSNILVVRDPANPENEGKVKLFRYGQKIMNKIEAKMNPEFEGESRMNPFDLWDGANLRLKIRTEGKTAANPKGFRNYDQSEWDQPGPLAADDAEMERIWKEEFSLQDLIAPDKFKTYEELKAEFERATGETQRRQEQLSERTTVPREDPFVSPRDRFATTKAPEADDSVPWDNAEDDKDLDYYRKLIEDDDVPF